MPAISRDFNKHLFPLHSALWGEEIGRPKKKKVEIPECRTEGHCDIWPKVDQNSDMESKRVTEKMLFPLPKASSNEKGDTA